MRIPIHILFSIRVHFSLNIEFNLNGIPDRINIAKKDKL